MKKLTAKKCRQRILELKVVLAKDQLSMTGEIALQAMEIALPILERQESEGLTMNYEEAMKAVREGKKVTHEYFTGDEYFCSEGGQVVCERGCSMRDWYKGEDWQKTGWMMYD